MCAPEPPRPGTVGAVVLAVVAACAVVGVVVAAVGAVTVAGLSAMSVLLIVGTLVTAHKVGEAIWPDIRRAAPRPAPALDEVVVHAEVVAPPRRAITGTERAADTAWAEQRLYGRP